MTLFNYPDLTGPGAHSRTVRLLLLQALALLAVGAVTLLDTRLTWSPLHYQNGDVWRYYDTAVGVLHGQLPYRDFALEYPPLAILPFLVPLLLAGGHTIGFPAYCWLLLAENVVLSTIFAWTLAATARDTTPPRGGALAWYVAGVVILSPLLPWRYDLFPALLTLLALRAVQKRRPTAAGVWLGLGVAAKLYPLVFLPVLAAYYWLQGERRSCARLVTGGLAAVAASVLPFAAAGPRILSFLQYHQHRGIELESLAAGAIFTAHLLGRLPVLVVFNYGAYHLVSPITPVLLRVIPWTALLLLGATAAWAWGRMRADAARTGGVPAGTLTICLTAMLLAFVVTNKVFSPQYLIWFLPLAPLLPGRGAAPFGVASVLTILLFPFCLDALLVGAPWAVGLLLLRNLLMVGLWACLVFPRRIAPSCPPRVLPIITGSKTLSEHP